MKSETIGSLLERISGSVIGTNGPTDLFVAAPAPLSAAGSGDVTFCNAEGDRAIELIRRCNATAILVAPDALIDPKPSQVIIAVDKPRLRFIQLIQQFAAAKPQGIHPSATIDSDAQIDPSAYVGPHCYVGKSRIGAGSVLWGNVFVYNGVTIGENVAIHAGAVLGADGFGYERDPDTGEMIKFPHFAGITVENDVEIGANTCIDRGTLSNTLIRRGAKIDNFVHIAHNTDIGEEAVVIAHAMIGGSTRIGNRAWVAPSACVRDKLNIGEDALIGLGSVVTKNVPPGETVVGSPARGLDEYKRELQALRKLTAVDA